MWGVVCHGYGIFDHAFNHDSLNAIFADATENTLKLEVGRFIVPLYRIFTRGPLAMPWIIAVLGFSYIALSTFLLTEIYETKSRPAIFVMGGIITTSITVTCQIASFVFEFDTNALALLLSVAAVYVWRRRKGITGLILGGVFLLLSLGIYQSYLTVAVTLMIHLSILDLLREEKPSAVVKRGLFGIGTVLFGGILYFCTNKLVCAVANVTPHSRTDIFAAEEGVTNLFSYYLDLLIRTYKQFYRSIIQGMPMHVIAPVIVLVAVLTAFVLVTLFRKLKKLTAAHKVLVMVLGVLLPFGANFIYILARGNVHDLMTMAVYFIYLLFLMIALRYSERKEKGLPLKNFVRFAAYAVVAVVLFQNTVIAGTVYLKKDLESDATLSTMTRVVDRLESDEDYIPGETVVAFVGSIDIAENTPGFDRISKITACQYTDSISLDGITPYYYTYAAYFRYIMKCPVRTCDAETMNRLKRMAEVEEMPSFPEKGSIKVIDGVTVVKMGDYVIYDE